MKALHGMIFRQSRMEHEMGSGHGPSSPGFESPEFEGDRGWREWRPGSMMMV
jgi:hypothetical protein